MLDQQQLRVLILKANREELIQYIDTCLKEMTDQQIDSVFGDLYYEQVVQQGVHSGYVQKVVTSPKISI